MVRAWPLLFVIHGVFSGTPAEVYRPQFNNSKCPAFWELQAPHVPTDFNIDVMNGYFYELAFHDWTQFPTCVTPPKCITSDKAVQRRVDGSVFVNDSWALNCFGQSYPVELLFNVTEQPGFLRGYISARRFNFVPKSIEKILFPDTVVDFKAGPDGWLLEMQCVEFEGRVIFVGVNYYSKTKTEAAFQEIDAAARARGLGFWIDRGFGLKRVDHSNCPNEPHLPAASAVVV